MANTKNTIQTIPLSGSLNLNTLKTSVRQFEGFNEKNSTVYGGTLSPMYQKSIEDLPEGVQKAYGVLNKDGKIVYAYIKNNRLKFSDDESKSYMIYNKQKLNVPKDAPWATSVYGLSMFDAWLQNGTIWTRVRPWGQKFNPGNEEAVDTGISITTSIKYYSLILPTDNSKQEVRIALTTFYYNDSNYLVVKMYILGFKTDWTNNVITARIIDTKEFINQNDEPTDIIVTRQGGIPSGSMELSVVIGCGKMSNVPRAYSTTFSLTNNTLTNFTQVNYYYLHTFKNVKWNLYGKTGTNTDTTSASGYKELAPLHAWGDAAYDVYPECARNSYAAAYLNNSNVWVTPNSFTDIRAIVVDSELKNSNHLIITGHDGKGFIPNAIVGNLSSDSGYAEPAFIQTIHQNGALMAITSFGVAIESYYVIDSYNIDYDTPQFYYGGTVCYHTDQGWFMYRVSNEAIGNDDVDYVELSEMFIDNRYAIRFPGYGRWAESYDIVTDKSKVCVSGLPCIAYPCIRTRPENTTRLNDEYSGVVYAGGYNAGYTTTGDNLVGILTNPMVMLNCPRFANYKDVVRFYTFPFEYYYNYGSTAQSAIFYWDSDVALISNPELKGTDYPIDTNGNIMLPWFIGAKIENGYSNNDLLINHNTAYPLVYYNINEKIYNYYLLSAMENVLGGFSLQGQSYTYDENTIYATSYDSGILQSSQPVAYKRNLTFLGTLPTQAVFYSYFNKTFYAYTGDRVLSKMFEASDINEIKYVGQNPSSLSLWICTDNGTYIISDTDMYKIDHASERVFFTDDHVILMNADGYTRVALRELTVNGETLEPVPLKLKTAYYGLGNEQKAVMDCWYIRLFDENKTEGDVKVRVNTITDVTKQSEEKVFHVSPSDYDENNIVYLRYQPQYQECTAMQLELESPIGIYELAVGVNATDSAAQISKFNF